MYSTRPAVIFWLSLALVGAATWWVYAKGLHGNFLFDDFANLPALGSFGPVTHWATFFRYITSGAADPTGRPLTLLTFLIDGHDWPTAAYPFKRTSLVLHLINGALLAQLLVQLTRRALTISDRSGQRRVRLVALTAASLWMIHPLFVSTVLYVVQREAMLPATFVLAGLLLWLRGRSLFLRGRLVAGIAAVAGGLGACSVLGILSKANGALLPMYAVLIEYFLLQRQPPGQSLAAPDDPVGTALYRRTFQLFGWLPAAGVIFYLIYAGIAGSLHGIDRPWTTGQRLLTEPRVLFDYLTLLWTPRPFTPGVFNDQIIPSVSLWFPATTWLSILGLSGLLALGWGLRRRHPVITFTIFFYFAGQLIESSSLPLELYYEHRNYIPAMFRFWPLSMWLWDVVKSPLPRLKLLKILLAGVIFLGLAAMTRASADLWGNSQEQALLWATLNPASARAQANAANQEMEHGYAVAADRRLESVLPLHPFDPQITLNILSAHCQMDGIKMDDVDLAKNTMAHLDQGEQVVFHWIGDAIDLAATHACAGLAFDDISSMLDAAEQNPKLNRVAGYQQDIYHLRGQLALAQNQTINASIWFKKAIAIKPSPQIAFEQAALFGSAGYPAAGLEQLDIYGRYKKIDSSATFGMPWIHEWVLYHLDYWNIELMRLRTTLQDDLKQSRAPKIKSDAEQR